jgi:tetratricopeptide (TPR) repeat protein
LAFASLWGVLSSAACGQSGSSAGQPSFFQSLTSPFRQSPAPKSDDRPADDPVSLQSKGKPGIELYVAVARLDEEQGNFAEAEAQYRRALQQAPNDLRPLLGYARLQDRLGRTEEALKLYQRAAHAHPQEPPVFNNMAIHYARRGALREAIGAMDRAIQLRPYEPRYRDNMAMLLVEADRPQEALFHMQAVHGEAVAHYNLGYLLNKKGRTAAAAQEFAIALRLNPGLTAAHQWLDRLGAPHGPGAEPPRFGPPAAPEEPRIAAVPRPPRIDAPLQGPLAAPPAAPEAMAVRFPPPPPQSRGAAPPQDAPRDPQPLPGPPPQPDAAAPQRLPPVSDSGDPELVPPYFPPTR